jgi:hypothetical protein
MAKENVVYILGAGFSAPLGIPTLRNFWEKSKAMIRDDNTTYGYFTDLLAKMSETVRAANYFQYENWNIEEALSMLEISETLESSETLQQFKQYICDVVNFFTKKNEFQANFDRYRFPNNWFDLIFGQSELHQSYGHFVASLHNLRMTVDSADSGRGQSVRWVSTEKLGINDVKYSIVTLNYDCVLENITTSINANYRPIQFNAHFRGVTDVPNEPTDRPYLLKLHGSAMEGEIIFPTFNKGLYMNQIPQSWRIAYNVLKQATQVRIVGYSLPESDAYIKYLLKAAISHSSNVDRIDILCLDDEKNTVEDRYERFVSYKNRHFKNASIELYLRNLLVMKHLEQNKQNNETILFFDRLEQAHQRLFPS